jgi:hypothetical protein
MEGADAQTARFTRAVVGHLLAVLSPSSLEAFFGELGLPADGATTPEPLTGPPDIERLMAVASKHGIEML